MAARRLKADIEMVRRIAQQTSSTQSVTFDGPLTYSTSAGVAALNNQQATYAVDLAEPPFEIQTAVPNFDGGATISFNGYGAPASGGQVVLTAGDSERTVRVDGDTGQVTIEDTSPAGTN